ncbi:MAG: hypothetical protein Q7S55_04290 [Nanoarchaeota archaeon]|nr:hypothetical protein [Nanoarchaeota archaeon]
MLTLRDIIRVIKIEQALGIPALPVPRDHCSPEYYAEKESQRSLQEASDSPSYKIKIEFSRVSSISTREEYLHPNISYY